MVDDDRPLAGVLVLDFSQFLAGPVAALRLADLGARVIKIERPVTGEIGRTLAFGGLWRDGDTLSFHAMNRNKEAVVADLKDPGDLARVRELVAAADVLIQNFRPGVMERIGLDPASVARINPGLVYASASGYGAEGPWAGRPGQDLLAQSVSGLPWVSATGERPVPVGLSIADHLMSCHIAEGVTALLVRRARTGRGGLVETSLLEAMLDLQFERLTARLGESGARPHERAESDDDGRGSLTRPRLYPTRDGYLALGATDLGRLARLVVRDEPGDPDLAVAATQSRPVRPSAGDSADSHDWLDEVDRVTPPGRVRPEPTQALLARAFERRSTQAWLETLAGQDIPCAPVLTLEELLQSEAFTSLDMIGTVEREPREPGGEPVPVRTTRSPIRIDGRRPSAGAAAPRLGQQGPVASFVLHRSP